MSLRFRHLAILAALLFFALAAMLASWSVDFDSSTGLISRRAATLYAGIGVMFFVARNAPPSLGRSSLVAGFVTACLLLAVLGVFELVTGHANSGILLAILIEIALVLAFLFVARPERVDAQRWS